MSYFPDGLYTFYVTGRDGKTFPAAELAIVDDNLGFPSDNDREVLADHFPEGPIDPRTKAQLEKFLHSQHGYAYLEYSMSGNDIPSEEALEEGSAPNPADAGEVVQDGPPVSGDQPVD